jgi:hypothetical protein
MMWLAALILLPVTGQVEEASGQETVAAASTTPPTVTLQPLSGASQTGPLVELNGRQVVLEADGKRQSFVMGDLLALVARPATDPSLSTASIYVELIDGSRLLADSYRVKDRSAEVDVGSRTVTLATRNISTVRFHPPAAALNDQWREIVEGDNLGDVIVLRRSETALDQLEGIFHDVTNETVEFEYDEQRIPVKRTKLEGMVYYHPVGRELPEPVCVVDETGGTRWSARSVELDGQQLAVVTTAGTKTQIPWDQVARLDFSTGNVAYLSDLDFELVQCEPFYASRLPQEHIRQVYGPRRDESFLGPGLWLFDGDEQIRKFDKGLAIHSRSELVFRLTEPYRRLTAVAGIDSRPARRGNLILIITGDNRELFRRTIAGQDAPIELDLDLQGVRRLRILVDYGDSLDVADHLNLCDARIIK